MAPIILQWIGFVFIAAGTWAVGRSQLLASWLFIPGGICLASWCLTQQPLPLGVLGVQVVCVLFSVHNAEKLLRRHRHDRTEGDAR